MFEQLDDIVICFLCKCQVQRAVSLPCGHNTCKRCFDRYIGQGAKNCGLCRTPIPEEVRSNAKVNQVLSCALENLTRGLPRCKEKDFSEGPETAYRTERARKGGMANAASGRIFVSTHRYHFGAITKLHGKAVPVGEEWKFRQGCRQSGVHWPIISAIAGTPREGAQSFVYTGLYPGDIDNGKWFIATGSGGRDYTGNKRTCKIHSSHQTFTKGNGALETSCINGYPVRVVRKGWDPRLKPFCRFKSKIRQTYRYDGLYHVQRCWREEGPQGYLVCRFLFVRCDNSGSVWSYGMQTRQGPVKLPRDLVHPLASHLDVTELTRTPIWAWHKSITKWDWSSVPPVHTSSTSSRGNGNKARLETLSASILRGLHCEVCKGILKDPVTTPCGHNICKHCLADTISELHVRRRAQRESCPAMQCTSNVSSVKRLLKVNVDLRDLIKMLQEATGACGDAVAASKSVVSRKRPRLPGLSAHSLTPGSLNMLLGNKFGPIGSRDGAQEYEFHGHEVNVGETHLGGWEKTLLQDAFPRGGAIVGCPTVGTTAIIMGEGNGKDRDCGSWLIINTGRAPDKSQHEKGHRVIEKYSVHAGQSLRISCMKGYPVRVLRSWRMSWSRYVPKSGVRYDGIYLIDRCWEETDHQDITSDYFLLFRQDNHPAPWQRKDIKGDSPRKPPRAFEFRSVENVGYGTCFPLWDWNEGAKRWDWWGAPPES